MIIERGSEVNANIFANNYQILAKGANGNGNNEPEPTYMTGLFIANRVHGSKNVIWNASDVCDPCSAGTGGSPAPAPEAETIFDVNFWPNPSETVFNLEMITLNQKDEIYIQVHDMNNKLILIDTFNFDAVYQFGEKLESGVYIVRLTQGRDSKVVRLVKY